MIQLSSYQWLALASSILFIESIVFLVFALTFTWSIALIIELLMHYGLIVKLVHDSFFSGGVTLITRYHCWRLGVKIAESFKDHLNELSTVINAFFHFNEAVYNDTDLMAKSSILTSIVDLIYSYLNISNKLSHLSSYQKNMIISLNKLKMSLDDSKLLKCIEAAIKEMQSSKKKRIVDIKSEHLDAHLHRILSNIKEINSIIDNFLLQGNFIKKSISYLFNDTFGSLKQLKCELMSRFNCEAFKLPISKRVKLDCLLIRPTVATNEKKETVMLVCNRLSCPYELFAYYDKWIECYLSYGISIVLWNYRGYGESTGYPTFANIQLDANRLIQFIAEKHSFRTFGVHGISLGVIPAAFLVKEQKVTFCFADRSFNSIEKLVNNKLFAYAYWLLKPFLMQNVDIANMLLEQRDARVFKVVSYDLKKDYIDDCISLKTGIAQEFYKTVDLFSQEKSFLEAILNESEAEYEAFVNDIEYIIRKINDHKENEEKIELVPIQKELQTNSLGNDMKYQSLFLDSTHNDGTFSFSNDISILNSKVYSESRMIQIVKSLIEKFDAGGETLLSLNSKRKKEDLNTFFINLFAWGSFKIGQVYATDKLIAYRAISKKFSFLNQKLSKIVSDPTKYQISDPLFSSALTSLMKALVKIEAVFNSILFDKTTGAVYNGDYTLGNAPNEVLTNSEALTPSDSVSGDASMSFQGANLKSTSDSFRNAQLSSLIKTANVGNLLLLNCGHEGVYSAKELEMYSMYLLNSSFIS